MSPLTVAEIADLLGAPPAPGTEGLRTSGEVFTDSRRVPRGGVFFALRGERFDGDAFAAAALEAGAALAVVHRWTGGELPPDRAVIEVSDTLLALQKLAHAWRSRLDLPVVAITGSNGKTSTKDFTAAVLGRRFRVSATRGNFNNHIGLPLSVLATGPEHGAAVWEMGMNHSGEIAPLCEIARPKIGIITNIGTAHIEHLGSREGIAEEKGMLARALPSDGTLILRASCDFHGYFRERTRAHLLVVGNGRGLVRSENVRPDGEGTRFQLAIDGRPAVPVRLPVPGRHMVSNALLAAAAGWKLGLAPEEIAAGLESASLSGGRLRRFACRGVTVIDDTYNANPESMAAAIETLAETEVDPRGRRFAVLGRMGELGPHAAAAHRQAGLLAAERGIVVIAVGEGAEGIASGSGQDRHFPDLATAGAFLAEELRAGDAVLFKGSRSATVERVLHRAFPTLAPA